MFSSYNVNFVLLQTCMTHCLSAVVELDFNLIKHTPCCMGLCLTAASREYRTRGFYGRLGATAPFRRLALVAPR